MREQFRPSFAPNEILSRAHCRRPWEELIVNVPGYDFFMTIGFRTWLDLRRAEYSVNHLLLRNNRSLYGKHFKKHRMWLHGIGVLEFKSVVNRSSGSPHFHLLLKFPDGAVRPIAEVIAVLEKGAERLRYPTHCPERPFGRRICGADFVDVRPIHDLGGLANYLTKRLGPGRDGLNAANIFFVGADGIEGLDPQAPNSRF